MGKILKVVASLIQGVAPFGACDRSSSRDHNGADMLFVRALIAHHLQAMRMADLALQRADDDRVHAVARTIKFARPNEVRRLREWLDAWGETTRGAPDRVSDKDNSEHLTGTSAMISEAAIGEMAVSEQHGFDRLWLQMMIQHHERAVDACKTEQADGYCPEATRLARQVEVAQGRVVNQMQACLKT